MSTKTQAKDLALSFLYLYNTSKTKTYLSKRFTEKTDGKIAKKRSTHWDKLKKQNEKVIELHKKLMEGVAEMYETSRDLARTYGEDAQYYGNLPWPDLERVYKPFESGMP